MHKTEGNTYKGFEQGPIRPPSEAYSLLLRVTRNCPWNKCTFCRIYKKKKFSLRPVEHIKKDIDLLHTYIEGMTRVIKQGYPPDHEVINTLFNSFKKKDRIAFNAAMNWYNSGMRSIFLQDANSLIMPAAELVEVLAHIKKCFPDVERITSYARSHTIARIKDEELKRLADEGLNRIHIGLESGSDHVLKYVRKGTDKETHIKAGLKVKEAGMQLSEYYMPGLGGIDYSIDHALESASALNSINPDFIRIRTLAVSKGTPLAEETKIGLFEKPTDVMMAQELRLFLETLEGIDSYIKSDHILNLFETINGKLPEDKDKLIGIVDSFFALDQEDQILYQVGRRMGFFKGPEEMAESPHLESVRQACEMYEVTPDNVDDVIDQLMNRFV